MKIFEMQHEKMHCVLSEDSAQSAFPQSDQFLLSPHEKALDPWLFTEHLVKTDHTSKMCRLICTFARHIYHKAQF